MADQIKIVLVLVAFYLFGGPLQKHVRVVSQGFVYFVWAENVNFVFC